MQYKNSYWISAGLAAQLQIWLGHHYDGVSKVIAICRYLKGKWHIKQQFNQFAKGPEGVFLLLKTESHTFGLWTCLCFEHESTAELVYSIIPITALYSSIDV